MRVSKQWTDEGRTARKSVSGPRNVTSAREDRRLVRMAQTDHTAFSRQLAAQWSTATRVSLCASSIRRRLLQRGLRARIPLCRIPLTQNRRRLRLHWANVHRSWRADWQQVVFSHKSRFNLWHHGGRIRVRLYEGLPGAVFQQHNARPHVAKNVKSYLDLQQVQLLAWPAYSPDMSPIEHEWDIVGRRIARDLRPVASTDELWLRIQTIWNNLPQTDTGWAKSP
ncbi:transposable element Tcb2 transposase [Trichonephila clavipes]|nr:transposable element Tcb2 transposase [Trichonephila clavipes]